jgi:Zn finger protein HypA/HybF involved in hydrogenase expression
MVIKFLCPNGHQLSAPENMAGKKGKCPKCQSAFVVPTLEEIADAEADEAEQPVQMGTGAVSPTEPVTTPAMGSGKGLPPGELFVFLCPNGHRLNGPPSLKGKAGQCPHCGARFRIPTGDEEEEPAEDEAAPMQVVVGGEPAEPSGSGGFRFPIEQFMGEDATSETTGPPTGPSGMGYIFARLWKARDERTELEVFLHEGEILVPEHYSEVLSTSDYGVFAIQEGDGTYSITTIPWSSVRRVAMRKLEVLPGDLFS